jgi:hypothetical protein
VEPIISLIEPFRHVEPVIDLIEPFRHMEPIISFIESFRHVEPIEITIDDDISGIVDHHCLNFLPIISERVGG